MKRLFTIIAALVLCTVFAANVNAEEYKKSYQEKYSINADALLKTDTRYGDTKIINWTKNEISISVTITVYKSSQKKADEFFDKVKINLSGNQSAVTAETELKSLKGSNEFSIDYEIHAPKTISLDLNHKYGDAIVETIEGTVEASVKYGSFHAENITKSGNKISLAYIDKASVENLGDASLTLSYSEVDIENAGELDIDSKYNEIGIERATKLDFISKYDELNIENVDVMIIEGGFSEIEVENLSKKFVMDSDYGELDLNNVKAGFDLIEIETNHNDIHIDIEGGASYEVDLSGSYSSFSIPDGNYSVNQPSMFSESISGKIGSGSANSKVKVSGKYIDVTIK